MNKSESSNKYFYDENIRALWEILTVLLTFLKVLYFYNFLSLGNIKRENCYLKLIHVDETSLIKYKALLKI